MSTALFKIDYTGGSAGVSDTSRDDGVPNQLVTLTYTGVGAATYDYHFWDVQGPFATPTISGSTTSVATFTPAGGAAGFGQSFGIELVVDGNTAGAARRSYKIATQRQGLLLPLYAETADPKASIANSGSAFIAASTDNAGSNYRGYAPAFYTHLAQYELGAGRMVVIPSPASATGTVETWIGSAYLPVCTLNNVRAYLGAQLNTDTATLRVYRSSDSSLLTTLAVTGNLQDVVVSSVVVSQQGWYELHILGSQTSTVALCRGVFFDYKC